MQWLLFFSFILMKTYFPDSNDIAATSEIPSIAGRYEVIETDQPGLWNKKAFLLTLISPGADQREFVLAGFTNQGATVKAILTGHRLKFPRQTAEVIPEGGFGKVQWTIDMEADGVFREKILELNYRVFEPDSTVHNGKIRAEKIPE